MKKEGFIRNFGGPLILLCSREMPNKQAPSQITGKLERPAECKTGRASRIRK